MSKGINRVTLIGNLGRDPEVTYTPGGMAIATLSLCTTESRKKQDGTWEDVSEWHRVKVFGKTAEALGEHATKGSQIYIDGKIHYDSYEKDGIKRYTTDILANRVLILGKKTGDPGYQQQEQPKQQERSKSPSPQQDEIEDDLPF